MYKGLGWVIVKKIRGHHGKLVEWHVEANISRTGTISWIVRLDCVFLAAFQILRFPWGSCERERESDVSFRWHERMRGVKSSVFICARDGMLAWETNKDKVTSQAYCCSGRSGALLWSGPGSRWPGGGDRHWGKWCCHCHRWAARLLWVSGKVLCGTWRSEHCWSGQWRRCEYPDTPHWSTTLHKTWTKPLVQQSEKKWWQLISLK